VKKGEKNVSVEFRVFGKKMKMKERFRKKKSKCIELREKKKNGELKLWFLRKFKIRGFYLLGSYPLVGRHVD
jgi:hypothetical protein